MARPLDPARPRIHVLRFMTALKAAREFGLDPAIVEAVALRFDPLAPDTGALIDALAAALIEQGTVELPDAV